MAKRKYKVGDIVQLTETKLGIHKDERYKFGVVERVESNERVIIIMTETERRWITAAEDCCPAPEDPAWYVGKRVRIVANMPDNSMRADAIGRVGTVTKHHTDGMKTRLDSAYDHDWLVLLDGAQPFEGCSHEEGTWWLLREHFIVLDEDTQEAPIDVHHCTRSSEVHPR